MRKIIFTAFFLFFVFVLQEKVFAQEEIIASNSGGVLGDQTVDYTLAYPGILPDSPIYFVKVIRDKVVGFLIADSLKKGEFDLLQADKRLEASWLLLQKRPMQQHLVSDTLSKAENYFSEGIDQVTFAQKQGEETSDLLGKMEMSNKKHVEVVKNMEKLSGGLLKQKLVKQEERIDKLGELVNLLQKKN